MAITLQLAVTVREASDRHACDQPPPRERRLESRHLSTSPHQHTSASAQVRNADGGEVVRGPTPSRQQQIHVPTAIPIGRSPTEDSPQDADFAVGGHYDGVLVRHDEVTPLCRRGLKGRVHLEGREDVELGVLLQPSLLQTLLEGLKWRRRTWVS